MTNDRTARGEQRMRARDLGISIGSIPIGPRNAITDVSGVAVGHSTLIAGDGPLVVGKGPVRTGVTVILPRAGEAGAGPCFAGSHVLNGNGEMTGLAWVEESGLLTTPVAITNTHSVGVVRDALIGYEVARRSQRAVLEPARRRRDLRRLPQRHQRHARPPGARRRRAGQRE